MYLFLSSDDCKDKFDNKYFDFVTELPSYIDLSQTCGLGWQRDWRIAITEVALLTEGQRYISSLPTDCAILCNLVSDSYLKGRYAPLLRILSAGDELKASVGSTYYMSIRSSARSFNEIRISLRDSDLNKLDLAKWPEKATIFITLHIVLE